MNLTASVSIIIRESVLISLILSFLICKIWMLTPSSHGCCEDSIDMKYIKCCSIVSSAVNKDNKF